MNIDKEIAANAELHQCHLVLQIHDELGSFIPLLLRSLVSSHRIISSVVYEVPREVVPRMVALVKRNMESAMKLSVDLTVQMCLLSFSAHTLMVLIVIAL